MDKRYQRGNGGREFNLEVSEIRQGKQEKRCRANAGTASGGAGVAALHATQKDALAAMNRK